ncbi:hypothetical protein Srufu_003870 [Streptomyces libani subsp. rufus]|nr:hypothetical protein Srufu_003870 [Streptomyces libani subsp. rufus]
MGKLADRIAAALAKAAPADAFRHHAKAFKERLKTLEGKEQQIRAAQGDAPVAVTERFPLYLTEASGLRNKIPAEFSQAVEEGSDVSPRSLRQMLALFTGNHVKALIYNQQTSSPETEQVKEAAEEHGIAVVPVTETLPRGARRSVGLSPQVSGLGSLILLGRRRQPACQGGDSRARPR